MAEIKIPSLSTTIFVERALQKERGSESQIELHTKCKIREQREGSYQEELQQYGLPHVIISALPYFG